MEQTKYDVFLSYSHKDYVDERYELIPDNEVSKIKDALTEAGIRYWFDDEGIYSGQNFVERIVNNIDASKILVFLSSKNANDSEWTCKEIACADELGKVIIPVRIDKSHYNKKVLFRISDLDFIAYYANPEKGLTELINAIKAHLEQMKEKTDDDSVVSVDKVSNLKGIDLFDDLRTHVFKKHTLRIKYKSYRASIPDEFVFFPYIMKEFRHRWFLVGSPQDSKEIVNLALDRIISFEIERKVPFWENDGVDINHYYDDVIGVSRYLNSKPEDVLFWASKKVHRYIETKPLHSSQKVIRYTSDGGCVFGMHVMINLELFSVLMSYGSNVIVLSPHKAAKYIRKEFYKATLLYADEEGNLKRYGVEEKQE